MVARVVDRRHDPHLERAQVRLFRPAFEPADALVDQGEQVGDAEGHRRVRRDRTLLAGAPHEPAFRRAAEGALGLRHQIAQDVHLLDHRLAAAEDDLGELVQPEQPEGQFQRICIDDDGKVAEGGGEFVVRVEDQDTQIRIGLDRLVKQQGDGGGLADAGSADDGEMLLQHGGNVDRRVEALVLRQLADDAHVLLAGVVDHREVRGADAVGDGAEIGIVGDAGGEFLMAIRADANLAQKFDLDAEDRVVLLRPVLLVGGHGIDECDDAVAADGDGDEPADDPQFRERRLAGFGHRADGGTRAAAGDDAAQQAVSGRHSVAAILFAGHQRGLKIIVQHVRHSLPSGPTLPKAT